MVEGDLVALVDLVELTRLSDAALFAIISRVLLRGNVADSYRFFIEPTNPTSLLVVDTYDDLGLTLSGGDGTSVLFVAVVSFETAVLTLAVEVTEDVFKLMVTFLSIVVFVSDGVGPTVSLFLTELTIFMFLLTAPVLQDSFLLLSDTCAVSFLDVRDVEPCSTWLIELVCILLVFVKFVVFF